GRAGGRRPWAVCPPYELRAVGAYVRLGWRERAQDLLDYYLAGRRPAAWNQSAEVVEREPRGPSRGAVESLVGVRGGGAARAAIPRRPAARMGGLRLRP